MVRISICLWNLILKGADAMSFQKNDQMIWSVDSISESADVLVYMMSSDGPNDLPVSCPDAIRVAVDQMKERGQWGAKSGEVSVLPTYGLVTPLALALCGTGAIADSNGSLLPLVSRKQNVEQAMAMLVKALSKRKLGNVQIIWANAFQQCPVEEIPVMMEAARIGWKLGHFQLGTYAKDAKTPFEFQLVNVNVPCSYNLVDESFKQSIQMAWDRAGIVAESVCEARELVNKPGNLLVPEGIAKYAEQLGESFATLQVHVLREEELLAKGMGAILAVGQGSVNPPRMIVIRYHGDPESSEWTGIVGKGITFDTGGISLKQAKGMEEMIGDMGGAAAVLGTMQSIAQLKPTVNILGIIATAENMPGGNAYKPGDVVTSYSKRTIEVLNTDAEGRVVLADAITYAKELGATRLVDLATLTGAILVALAHEATGAVTNNQELLDSLTRASEWTGEHVWQLPVYQAYKDMLKSDVADLKNATGPHAGSITAGLFIGTFAENTPWVHLDIAGTSWLDRASGVNPKGGTGVMIRTLVHWLTT